MSRQDELQDLFLEHWYSDLQDGITPRNTHKMLQEHLQNDEAFQRDSLQRLMALETNGKRDAETRQMNGTGSHFILPPAHFKPWWARDPWRSGIKYALIVAISMGAGWVARHYSMPPPPPPAVHVAPTSYVYL